jgi:hypothetical protein
LQTAIANPNSVHIRTEHTGGVYPLHVAKSLANWKEQAGVQWLEPLDASSTVVEPPPSRTPYVPAKLD